MPGIKPMIVHLLWYDLASIAMCMKLEVPAYKLFNSVLPLRRLHFPGNAAKFQTPKLMTPNQLVIAAI